MNAIPTHSQDYLRQALKMNPVWEAPNILKLRRAALGLKRLDQEDAITGEDTTNQRDIVRNQVAMLQREFWKLPLEQLQRSINAVDVSRTPEYAPVVTRLATTAACRGEFPKLLQMKGMDLSLFNAFKSAVVLPPAEAARVRERFMRSINDKRRLKEVQRAARLIHKEYPILHALEQDWFTTLGKMKLTYQTNSVVPGGLVDGIITYLTEVSWIIWLAFFALLKLLLTGMQ